MTRDELEAILCYKEREAGLASQRRPHFHECVKGCRVLEACGDQTCTETPSGKRLPCTQRTLGFCAYCGDMRLMGVVHVCPQAFAAAERRVMTGGD
jgi:hypothetical protein